MRLRMINSLIINKCKNEYSNIFEYCKTNIRISFWYSFPSLTGSMHFFVFTRSDIHPPTIISLLYWTKIDQVLLSIIKLNKLLLSVHLRWSLSHFQNKVWEHRPIQICWELSKEVSGMIFITSLVWCGSGPNPQLTGRMFYHWATAAVQLTITCGLGAMQLIMCFLWLIEYQLTKYIWYKMDKKQNRPNHLINI